MTQKYKVMLSFNEPGEQRCVDVFQRPDEIFGFEEYRRDVEDNRGWFPIGNYSRLEFTSSDAAKREACRKVRWLVVAA